MKAYTAEKNLPREGFRSIRRNEVRDVTANLLTEVCNDVRVEPELQSMTREELSGQSAITTDGARLDLSEWLLGWKI